ncbi:MAG: protein-glutamate O-methyltransferase CheR [Melioribacteraceae bacterium]|nr:protein-glutamate O-methyltransferase CheR [Melioribacteraceae bacterium]
MAFFSESIGISDSTFQIIRDLIHFKTGIYFENDKKDLLADKLSNRVLENGFTNFTDYYFKLKYEDSDTEWKELINCITVNETYFWREFDQINVIVNHLIPDLFENQKRSKIRIWSAACSTGEEPLTLAMAINEAGYFDKYSIQILASDASTNVINRAKSGLYKDRSFRNIPEDIKNKYFTKIDFQWKIDTEIHNKVDWFIKNLKNQNEFSFLYSSDIILCRNVFIYFSDEAIKEIVNTFYDKMPQLAYLFVGISESLLKLKTRFELIEKNNTFLYIKNEQ